MGAKHPQDVIKKTGASKYDFIVACQYLIRAGIVKKPSDAIRYIEDNNSNIDDLIDEYIAKMREESSDEFDGIQVKELVPDELR